METKVVLREISTFISGVEQVYIRDYVQSEKPEEFERISSVLAEGGIDGLPHFRSSINST